MSIASSQSRNKLYAARAMVRDKSPSGIFNWIPIYEQRTTAVVAVAATTVRYGGHVMEEFQSSRCDIHATYHDDGAPFDRWTHGVSYMLKEKVFFFRSSLLSFDRLAWNRIRLSHTSIYAVRAHCLYLLLLFIVSMIFFIFSSFFISIQSVMKTERKRKTRRIVGNTKLQVHRSSFGEWHAPRHESMMRCNDRPFIWPQLLSIYLYAKLLLLSECVRPLWRGESMNTEVWFRCWRSLARMLYGAIGNLTSTKCRAVFDVSFRTK